MVFGLLGGCVTRSRWESPRQSMILRPDQRHRHYTNESRIDLAAGRRRGGINRSANETTD